MTGEIYKVMLDGDDPMRLWSGFLQNIGVEGIAAFAAH